MLRKFEVKLQKQYNAANIKNSILLPIGGCSIDSLPIPDKDENEPEQDDDYKTEYDHVGDKSFLTANYKPFKSQQQQQMQRRIKKMKQMKMMKKVKMMKKMKMPIMTDIMLMIYRIINEL